MTLVTKRIWGNKLLEGYFTLESPLVGKTSEELDYLLGYEKGTLKYGYDVYAFARLPHEHEFRKLGYTHLKDGGLPNRETAYRDSPLYRASFGQERHFQQIINVHIREKNQDIEMWKVRRPVKVVPWLEPRTYPQAAGILQWKLNRPVDMRHVKTVTPDEIKRGAGRFPKEDFPQ